MAFLVAGEREMLLAFSDLIPRIRDPQVPPTLTSDDQFLMSEVPLHATAPTSSRGGLVLVWLA